MTGPMPGLSEVQVQAQEAAVVVEVVAAQQLVEVLVVQAMALRVALIFWPPAFFRNR